MRAGRLLTRLGLTAAATLLLSTTGVATAATTPPEEPPKETGPTAPSSPGGTD